METQPRKRDNKAVTAYNNIQDNQKQIQERMQALKPQYRDQEPSREFQWTSADQHMTKKETSPYKYNNTRDQAL